MGKRNYMWSQNIRVQIPDLPFTCWAALGRWLLNPSLLPRHLHHAILRAPEMYRNVHVVAGLQEAFNKYLLAKQLHKATQIASGKTRIKTPTLSQLKSITPLDSAALDG